MTTLYTKPISPRLANSRIQNLLGLKFNRLLIVQFVDTHPQYGAQWLCLCDCGNTLITAGTRIKGGYTRTCCCLRREINVTHGESRNSRKGFKSVEYTAYIMAKSRCENPKETGYERYGGRGIEFRFKSFPDFLAAVGRKLSPEMSLDRFPDNDGHYEKGNVRWATPQQQAVNRHNTAHYLVNGELKTTRDIVAMTGMPRQRIYSRKYLRGWCDVCTVNINTKHCPHK